jgi:polar amino acid transport system substrate-binding protein
LISAALAQNQSGQIRAVTIVAPPFVMKQGDHLTGFTIDLWNEISARLKLTTSYQVAASASATLDAMQTKSADIVVAPVFYSTERDAQFRSSSRLMN